MEKQTVLMDLNIQHLNMSTLTKLIHSFNTIVNKMPGRLFVNIGKLILKCI